MIDPFPCLPSRQSEIAPLSNPPSSFPSLLMEICFRDYLCPSVPNKNFTTLPLENDYKTNQKLILPLFLSRLPAIFPQHYPKYFLKNKPRTDNPTPQYLQLPSQDLQNSFFLLPPPFITPIPVSKNP